MNPVHRTGITFVIFFLFVINASAQHKEDVLYLKNGSVIHGLILNDSVRNNIRILNHAGDILSFEASIIDTIRHEKPFEYKAFVFNRRGSEFNLNGALLIHSGNHNIGKTVIPGISAGYGYRFQPYFTAGTELGIEFYEWLQIPVSVFVRFRMSQNTVSPIFYFKTGYSLPAEKRDADWDYSYTGSGGPLAIAGIGVEKILSENASFNFSFSWNYQELNYHLLPRHQWVRERDRTETYNRFRLTLGYVFK